MRNLNTTLAGALSNGVVQPAYLLKLTLKSGVENVWSGVGDLVYNGDTYQGVGMFGNVGAITEGTAVQADGTTVTLSGIGLSQVPVPAYPVTPPAPPFTPPAGQSVAWAFPSRVSSGPFTAGSTNGSAAATLESAYLTMTAACGLCNWGWGAVWDGFELPPEIPAGATIVGFYPVLTVVSTGSTVAANALAGSGITMATLGGPIPPQPNFLPSAPVPAATYYGSNQADCIEAIAVRLFGTIGGTFFQDLTVSFVGAAIYYTSTAQTSASLMYEALNDVRIGAPAKLWWGLMANGAFLGAPYLVFSGTVDKPTVNIGPDTSSIVLALENRLINLQRPTMRRYTSADQNLSYPTDIGFNWVETLNDIALRWGS
jgi:hypothetical protein